MLTLEDYLRLLPKAELHCHFVSTMRVATLVELAATHDIALKTDDLDKLLEYEGLPDFLDVFNAAHRALTTGDEIARVAYEGVVDAVRDGNLRYREYFVAGETMTASPQNVIDAIAGVGVVLGVMAQFESPGCGWGDGRRVRVAHGAASRE